jgi:hypothetical protein
MASTERWALTPCTAVERLRPVHCGPDFVMHRSLADRALRQGALSEQTRPARPNSRVRRCLAANAAAASCPSVRARGLGSGRRDFDVGRVPLHPSLGNLEEALRRIRRRPSTWALPQLPTRTRGQTRANRGRKAPATSATRAAVEGRLWGNGTQLAYSYRKRRGA